METNHTAAAKACCADLYQSNLARMILGDTLHPGGLRLTNRLGRLMDLQRGDWVVDLASGTGVSALAISRTFHCRVIGIEFGREATLAAANNARSAAVPAEAWFVQGDAESPPLKTGIFHGVLSECSLSLFPDKLSAIRRAVKLLRQGGRLGISDVTLNPGCLPAELGNALGQILCLTDALPVDGYQNLLREAGLKNIYREDASEQVTELIGKIRAGLHAFSLLDPGQVPSSHSSLFPGLPPPASWIEVLDKLDDLVAEGNLGYWLFVGEKP